MATCHIHVPVVLISGSLNLLEPSGPVKTRNGIALPVLYTHIHLTSPLVLESNLLLRFDILV
jgi:hypothetical protein